MDSIKFDKFAEAKELIGISFNVRRFDLYKYLHRKKFFEFNDGVVQKRIMLKYIKE